MISAAKGLFVTMAKVCVATLLVHTSLAAGRLEWRGQENKVTAEITSGELVSVLEQIASATGWHIYVEPGTRHAVSTKFKDRTVGEALHALLGNLSYVRVPAEGNAPAKLYVFRTTREEATQRITARKQDPTAKPIPNELIVKVKPGVNIDELAAKLGAKVLGRAAAANTYRLGFDSPEAAEAARRQLENSPDVEGVDSNFWMHRPEMSESLNPAGNNGVNLKPRTQGECSGTVVGLIDTAVQPTGTSADQFLLPSISVAGQPTALPSEPTHGTSMFMELLQGASQKQTESSMQVLPVDVYGPKAETTTFDVANGIIQAINKGANVINLSLGSAGDSEFLRGVVRAGSQRGVLFLAAAGNEPDTIPRFPAAYPEVLAVTARGRDGGIASYANRGNFVDLLAPGTGVFPFQGQNWMVSGTSAASAYASGVAASLWDCNKMNAAQISAAMQQIMPVKP